MPISDHKMRCTCPTPLIPAFALMRMSNLATLREIFHRYQADLVATRMRSNLNATSTNRVTFLFSRSPGQHLPDKLTPKCLGPYKVVKQTKNDISCRSLIDGSVHTFHVARLKLFMPHASVTGCVGHRRRSSSQLLRRRRSKKRFLLIHNLTICITTSSE